MPGLELDISQLPMAERLILGAERAKQNWNGQAKSGNFLRADQNTVYADFLDYLWDTAANQNEDGQPPMARIIQPPRTGKTVIASQIVAGTGLTATVIVPSRVLIKQTVDEMRRWLKDVPIGMFYGENKDLVENGVNIATYAILQQRVKDNDLPKPISSSALVFADEGHQSMTSQRQNVLLRSFHPEAIRIALTATPDYSEDRTLCKFFPDLIHEVTFEEAIRLDLLAPYRFWLGEVDVSGSRVRMFAGDYVDDDIGKLMSEAPFFKAVELFRYAERNRRLGALICCATREQAAQLNAYLKLHRPAGLPAPKLILGNTPEKERNSILRRFENGRVDTLINVGVLIQGWNSPRCKLLIDLAPSTSRVRAAQKFSRPLTRNADDEARIVMFVPKQLPVMPLMPVELFGGSLSSYTAGELIGSQTADGTKTAAEAVEIGRTPIKDVILKSRMVFTQTHRQPKLDPKDLKDIRRVLESCPDFNPRQAPTYRRFRWLMFSHELFQGRGLQLLRYLGYQSVKTGYYEFLAKTFPEGAAHRILIRNQGYKPWEDDSVELAPHELRDWYESVSVPTDTFREISAAALRDRIRSIVKHLTQREEYVVRLRFGLTDSFDVGLRCFDDKDSTLEELGKDFEVPRERIRQIEAKALRKLRHPSRSKYLQPFHDESVAMAERLYRPEQPRPKQQREPVDLEKQIEIYGQDRYRNLVRIARWLRARQIIMILAESHEFFREFKRMYSPKLRNDYRRRLKERIQNHVPGSPGPSLKELKTFRRELKILLHH